MSKIKGKLKGNKKEKEVSKKLSLWITKNERDDIFYKSQSSGARYTIRKKLSNKETYNQDGDITSTHPIGDLFIKKIRIEVKHYKNIDLWSLLTHTKEKNIYNWFSEYLKVSEENNKSLILIIVQNYKPELFVCNKKLAVYLKEKCNLVYNLKFKTEDEFGYIYLFEDFLKLDYNLFNNFLNDDEN